jgi:hypothetical protein
MHGHNLLAFTYDMRLSRPLTETWPRRRPNRLQLHEEKPRPGNAASLVICAAWIAWLIMPIVFALQMPIVFALQR